VKRVTYQERMKLAKIEKHNASLRNQAAMYSLAAAITPYVMEILLKPRKKRVKERKQE
jgi:hypothetical protein